MGLAEGLCGGAGGSQHLHAEGFYSNGVQGGMTPVAAGLALAEKMRGSGGLAAVCIGDGTTGEGILYEAMNLAGVWKLPLLFLLERNGYAQSTDTSRTIAGDLAKRAEGFGLSSFRGDVWHPGQLCRTAREAADAARSGAGPALLAVDCFRLNAHSKGDDNRPADLVAPFREKDPLARFGRGRPDEAAEFARDAEAVLDRALAEIAPEPCRYAPPPAVLPQKVAWREIPAEPAGRHGEAAYRALGNFLAEHPEAVLLGEDIEPPYGGAFKITRDLGSLFPGRVLGTPISEAGIVGVGSGLALAGFRPVVEIMFGDFLTLTFDQLQQHAAKFAAMYGGGVKVPLIVRTPSGGRRGYGPTHSQSLEKHFLGVPGLSVAALNGRVAPDALYRAMAENGGVFLLVENKTLYTRLCPSPLPDGYLAWRSDEAFPTVRMAPRGGAADVTVACYGGMLEHAEAALADAFRRDEILCEVLCYSRLSPLNPEPLLESLGRTGRLLTLEEGPGFAGWGAELTARAAAAGVRLKAADRLSYDGLIPASAAREAELLPGAGAICEALRRMTSAGIRGHDV